MIFIRRLDVCLTSQTLHADAPYSVGFVHLDGHLVDSVRGPIDHFEDACSTQGLSADCSGELKTHMAQKVTGLLSSTLSGTGKECNKLQIKTSLRVLIHPHLLSPRTPGHLDLVIMMGETRLSEDTCKDIVAMQNIKEIWYKRGREQSWKHLHLPLQSSSSPLHKLHRCWVVHSHLHFGHSCWFNRASKKDSDIQKTTPFKRVGTHLQRFSQVGEG